MIRHAFILGAGAVLAIGIGSTAARAQYFENEMGRLHAACESGDRGACVRFGSAMHEHREHEGEWRRNHADWYWWDRR
ncbi:MAG: hypothetical protein JO032_13450 [Alphaproteobacteria bacterium]|nr:hypothetical protein [Alphaproteobacteria bacterium]MBV9553782.1 hypothetical protein [Alphaproteobacteria bacterium]